MEDQHQQAIRTLAAERYMLGQMTDAERETFEEHYFDCRFCVEDIKGIDVMSRAVRQQPKQQPVRKWRPMTVAPWAVAASLAGALALQPIVMRTAPVIPLAEVEYVSPVPLKQVTRSVAAPTKLPAGRRITQYLEIVHDPLYTLYRWELRADEAKSLGSGTVTPDKTADPIPIGLGPLPAGLYELVVEGVRKDGNRSPIIIYPLVVGGS
ncbi:MAG TPA: hypothetical protein VE974_03995 [Thermoanaerobaculia bacterium]|nr:hypothetical protein [Thermoanaerobaculia bacterium]